VNAHFFVGLIGLASLACDAYEEICSCPGPIEDHRPGPLGSIAGGRTLTVTGDIVEVRENDGSTVRYRLLAPPKNEYRHHGAGPVRCGPRPAAYGLRSFSIVSSGETTDIFRIHAEGGNRLVDATMAAVSNQYGSFRSETRRAADGSVIDVLIDLSSGPTIFEPIGVSLDWTIETPGGERIPDGVAVQLGRSGTCQAVPCPDIGQPVLPVDIRCH
jgi:hypothetical protein